MLLKGHITDECSVSKAKVCDLINTIEIVDLYGLLTMLACDTDEPEAHITSGAAICCWISQISRITIGIFILVSLINNSPSNQKKGI